MTPPPWPTDHVAGDRARRHGSPRAAWLPPWPATHVGVDTGPRLGRCRCWGTTCAGAMAPRAAPAPCAGASTVWTTGPNGYRWKRPRYVDAGRAAHLAQKKGH